MSKAPTFEEVRCVGMHFRPPEARAMAEALLPGDTVQLEREPFNPHDSNAIKVMLHETHIGYVAANQAIFVASYMDEGHEFVAEVTGRQGQYPLLTISPATQELIKS